jgi:hypothetical protein
MDNDDALDAAMIEQLNGEDLACAGLRLANDDWGRLDVSDAKALAPSAPPKRRRRPSLESQVRQVLKASRAAGVPVVITIEGPAGKVMATPVKTAVADSDFNEWDAKYGGV